MALLELVGDNDLPGIDRYLQKLQKERGKAGARTVQVVLFWKIHLRKYLKVQAPKSKMLNVKRFLRLDNLSLTASLFGWLFNILKLRKGLLASFGYDLLLFRIVGQSQDSNQMAPSNRLQDGLLNEITTCEHEAAQLPVATSQSSNHLKPISCTLHDIAFMLYRYTVVVSLAL